MLDTISTWQLPMSDGTVPARLDDLLAKVHTWNTFERCASTAGCIVAENTERNTDFMKL
jgi:hypothetical protein